MAYKAVVTIHDTHRSFSPGSIIPDDALTKADIAHFLKIGGIVKYDASSDELQMAKDDRERHKKTPEYAVRHQAHTIVQKLAEGKR